MKREYKPVPDCRRGDPDADPYKLALAVRRPHLLHFTWRQLRAVLWTAPTVMESAAPHIWFPVDASGVHIRIIPFAQLQCRAETDFSLHILMSICNAA